MALFGNRIPNRFLPFWSYTASDAAEVAIIGML
jgi:hypothetical protein